MQCLIIPSIILVLLIPLVVLACKRDWEDWWLVLPAVVLALLSLLAIVGCPSNYLESRNRAWSAEQYYEHIIEPNAIAETETYITVQNVEAGIWQAGDTNVFDYNSYLVTTRYWQEIPIIKYAIFRVPEHLKYVRIGGIK